MTNKKPLHLFLGIVLIFLGAWCGLTVARVIFNLIRNPGGFSNPWVTGNLVLRIGLAAFCVWIGSREFQRATGQDVKKPKFRWGRMLAGASLVFMSLGSHFSPSPNAYKAENEAQAAGMLIATMLMVLVGLLLIASSFKARKSQSQPESI
jgi:cytochrome bd-type quinol oxidase subunit 2